MSLSSSASTSRVLPGMLISVDVFAQTADVGISLLPQKPGATKVAGCFGLRDTPLGRQQTDAVQ